jgi:hypothetical protein
MSTGSGDPFPPEIETATAATSAALQRLQGHWPRMVELGIATQASIYHSYPYLFLEAFPSLTADRLAPLCLASSLFADSLFVADDIMDDDPTDRDVATNLVRVQAMQFEGYRILYGLFPSTARFWDRFQDYLALYAQACVEERRFANGEDWRELTQALALRIAKGKSSLAKFVVAGLGELAGDETPVEPLTRALDRYYIARQMVDDLSDWRQDLERGYPSLLLARVATELAGASPDQLARDPERTGRVLYAGGHARYVMTLALRALDEAAELAAPYPDLLWHRITAKLRARCQTLLAELERLTRATEARPEQERLRVELTLPAAEDAWQELAWEALGSLLRRWRTGAGHAGHAGHAGDPGQPRAGSLGKLPRTLAAEALLDADACLHGQLRPLIDREARALLEPSPPGHADETDHRGRLLGLLARIDPQTREDRAEPHLENLLNDLLSQIESEDEALLAPLLTALDRFDRERFRAVVGRGIAWIEARQRPDGSWDSPGVRGPYLPTAACIELLAAVRPAAPALGRAAAFLRRGQKDDGGWGDAVSTALALLGLARLQPSFSAADDPERARRGCAALRSLARFDAPRPWGGTVTAAFTLQAALAWRPWDGPGAPAQEFETAGAAS